MALCEHVSRDALDDGHVSPSALSSFGCDFSLSASDVLRPSAAKINSTWKVQKKVGSGGFALERCQVQWPDQDTQQNRCIYEHMAFVGHVARALYKWACLQKITDSMLSTFGKPYHMKEALFWSLNVAEALDHLHNLEVQIVHRDVKLDNILLQASSQGIMEAKLSDFGLHQVPKDRKQPTLLVKRELPASLNGSRRGSTQGVRANNSRRTSVQGILSYEAIDNSHHSAADSRTASANGVLSPGPLGEDNTLHHNSMFCYSTDGMRLRMNDTILRLGEAACGELRLMDPVRDSRIPGLRIPLVHTAMRSCPIMKYSLGGPNPTTPPSQPQGGLSPTTSPSQPQGGPSPTTSPSQPQGGLSPNTSPSQPQGGPSPNTSPSQPQGGPRPYTSPSQPQGGPRPNTSPSQPQGGLSPTTSPSQPQGGPSPTTSPCQPKGGPSPATSPSQPHLWARASSMPSRIRNPLLVEFLNNFNPDSGFTRSSVPLSYPTAAPCTSPQPQLQEPSPRGDRPSPALGAIGPTLGAFGPALGAIGLVQPSGRSAVRPLLESAINPLYFSTRDLPEGPSNESGVNHSNQGLMMTEVSTQVQNMMQDEEFNLGDYDLAYNLTGDTGSIFYMAPEVRLGEPYNEKADVFSFAIVMYEIFSCSLLALVHIGCSSAPERICQGWRPPRVKRIPGGIWDLIEACWAQNPGARPDMGMVVDELKEMSANPDSLVKIKQSSAASKSMSSSKGRVSDISALAVGTRASVGAPSCCTIC
eukprot:gene5145-34955_t